MTAALEVRGLRVSFEIGAAWWPVVEDVSFSLDPGTVLALVGESGCGKSLTALSIMGLVDPPLRMRSASVRLAGEEIGGLGEDAMQRVRGARIGMVFQEPMTSLNPVLTVGEQIAEVLRMHRGLSAAMARDAAIVALRDVGIPAPEQRVDQYPHELSGGMKQRVMIAMAVACEPAVLIADEPTTALDVTVQAQIMSLLDRLRRARGMAMLLITHDLSLVAQSADRVAIMYAGEIVESAEVRALFRNPKHPYTRALLGSLPVRGARGQPLSPIEGTVPPPHAYPAGCRFSTRCRDAMQRCVTDAPPERGFPGDHRVRCWLHA